MLVKAAICSEIDNMRGVSGNIMGGQPAPIEDGSIDVIFDEETYADSFSS